MLQKLFDCALVENSLFMVYLYTRRSWFKDWLSCNLLTTDPIYVLFSCLMITDFLAQSSSRRPCDSDCLQLVYCVHSEHVADSDLFVEPEWALLIEHIRRPCFIDSPVLTVCTNGYHSVRICSNSQESLKDLLKYIYHLLHNVAPTGDAAIPGVFLLNNGSIWTGRWMVIQSSVFFSFLFFERLENFRLRFKRRTPRSVHFTLER